jgi:hypothetical protein
MQFLRRKLGQGAFADFDYLRVTRTAQNVRWADGLKDASDVGGRGAYHDALEGYLPTALSFAVSIFVEAEMSHKKCHS